MVVQLYRPNLDVIRQQAEAARAYEKKRKEDSEFKWGELSEGDNIIRPLPPTNSRGVIAKLVAKHYFNRSPIGDDIDAQPCTIAMFPHVAGVRCMICDIGDRIIAQFPQLDIKSWHKPGTGYYIQAVDRRDPAPVARLFRLTPAIHNWLNLQMEALLKDGVDLTDLLQGCDIKITKTSKKTRRGERTEYDKTLWNLKGLTAVHSDPAVVKSVLDSMVDPDEIWKYPDDEALASINKAAADVTAYYTKKAYSQPGVSLQVPGMTMPQIPMAAIPVQPAQLQQAAQIQALSAATTQAMNATPALDAASAIAALAAKQVQHSVAPVQVAQSTMAQVVVPAAPNTAGLLVTPQLNTAPAVAPTGVKGSPSDKPVCFGGAAPRPDGGIGYSDDSEVCLMCPSELSCMDLCKANKS